MKITKQAITLVEAVVVTLIISIGLAGVYLLYNNSMRFLDGIESKIQATQIAREGIEAIENIRDTNWINFSGDKENCWNTLNYDTGCIGGSNGYHIMGLGDSNNNSLSYKIYKNENNRWELEAIDISNNPGTDYKDLNYQNFYVVGTDENGFYIQPSDVKKIDINKGKITNETDEVFNLINRKIFTRRIEITHGIEINGLDMDGKEQTYSSGMLVKSIVQWRDMANSNPRKVELINVLTNWEKTE